MKFSKFFLLAVLLLSSHLSFSQAIYWADTLEYEYNSFGLEKWSGKKALGEPDAIIGDLDENAYRINKESEFGTIVVEFTEPRTAKRVVVIENNIPGRVTEAKSTL